MDIRNIGRAIDRGIAVLAPVYAARRARARGLIDAYETASDQVRRFEAASTGRNAGNWNATSGSMDAEIRPALARLRNRSRDMTANNCWAASAVEAYQTDLVGTGFLWKPLGVNRKPLPERLETKARRIFQQWYESTRCDIQNALSMPSMQSLIVREMIEAGEVIVRRIWTGETPVPFRLQVLEADHLDLSKDGYTLENGGRIVQGVEYDRVGRVRAYWLLRDHPGDWSATLNMTSERIPAEDVIHLFERLRAGQTRGIPRGTPAMMKLRDHDDYEVAEQLRMKSLACLVGFVHDLGPDEGPAIGSPTGRAEDEGDPKNGVPATRRFSPGTWQTLPPGKTITFSRPTGDAQFAEYSHVSLRAVAAGYGVSYEKLSNDLRNVNFSSGRMGALKYHANLERLTWLTFVPILLDRLWEWVTEAVAIAGDQELQQSVVARWTGPRRPMVDPSIEVPAETRNVRAGFKTRREVVRELGYDPEEVEQEFQAENAAADRLQLSFASDGRRSEQAPMPEPAQQVSASGSSE